MRASCQSFFARRLRRSGSRSATKRSAKRETGLGPRLRVCVFLWRLVVFGVELGPGAAFAPASVSPPKLRDCGVASEVSSSPLELELLELLEPVLDFPQSQESELELESLSLSSSSSQPDVSLEPELDEDEDDEAEDDEELLELDVSPPQLSPSSPVDVLVPVDVLPHPSSATSASSPVSS
jgi:hypothetical protein